MKIAFLSALLSLAPLSATADNHQQPFAEVIESTRGDASADFSAAYEHYFQGGNAQQVMPLDLVRTSILLAEGAWFPASATSPDGNLSQDDISRYCERPLYEVRLTGDLSFDLVRLDRDGAASYGVRYVHASNMFFSKTVDAEGLLRHIFGPRYPENVAGPQVMGMLNRPDFSGFSSLRFYSPQVLIIVHSGAVPDILVRCP